MLSLCCENKFMADKTAENGKNSLIQKTKSATGCAALGEKHGTRKSKHKIYM